MTYKKLLFISPVIHPIVKPRLLILKQLHCIASVLFNCSSLHTRLFLRSNHQNNISSCVVINLQVINSFGHLGLHAIFYRISTASGHLVYTTQPIGYNQWLFWVNGYFWQCFIYLHLNDSRGPLSHLGMSLLLTTGYNQQLHVVFNSQHLDGGK